MSFFFCGAIPCCASPTSSLHCSAVFVSPVGASAVCCCRTTLSTICPGSKMSCCAAPLADSQPRSDLHQLHLGSPSTPSRSILIAPIDKVVRHTPTNLPSQALCHRAKYKTDAVVPSHHPPLSCSSAFRSNLIRKFIISTLK